MMYHVFAKLLASHPATPEGLQMVRDDIIEHSDIFVLKGNLIDLDEEDQQLALSKQVTHAISVLLVDTMNQMEHGEISLEDVLTIVDAIALKHQDIPRQQAFYNAYRQLAKTVHQKINHEF